MNVIDLTHEMNASMSLFPGAALYSLEQTATIEEHNYIEHKITFTTHLGTHMDSPNHIVKHTKRLCDFEASSFIGSGLVIDLSQEEDFVTSDLLKTYPGIEDAEFLLFYTGHESFYGSAQYSLKFPILDASCAHYLCELGKKRLKGVGIDTFSIDLIEPVSIELHKVILGAGLLIIENLTNLRLLINQRFDFIGLPLKMEKIEASPIRAIAIITD
jgi:arylformamidase